MKLRPPSLWLAPPTIMRFALRRHLLAPPSHVGGPGAFAAERRKTVDDRSRRPRSREWPEAIGNGRWWQRAATPSRLPRGVEFAPDSPLEEGGSNHRSPENADPVSRLTFSLLRHSHSAEENRRIFARGTDGSNPVSSSGESLNLRPAREIRVTPESSGDSHEGHIV